MPSSVLVSSSTELRADVLDQVSSSDAGSVTIIAALGGCSVAQSSLLNSIVGESVFETNTRPGQQKTLGIHAAVFNGDNCAVQTQPPKQFVLLDVEGFDGPNRTRDERRDKCANLALAIADMVIFSVRMNDLARVESNGLSNLRVNLTEMFKLQDRGIIPHTLEKKLFMVVVRDYNADELPREELISGFLQEMQTMYTTVSKPARCPPRIADVFEFEFITLPSAMLAKEAFDDSIAILCERIKDPFCEDYLFENGAFAREDAGTVLKDLCFKIWESFEDDSSRDMPSHKELMATFGCDNTMRKVFEKYTRESREWHQDTEDGLIIEDFGKLASALLEETLSVFDEDAGPYRGARAFQRKRQELTDNINADLYNLFAKQILKLREISYGLFKEKLDDTGADDTNLEKHVNSCLKEAQKHFNEQAAKLRPRNVSWRIDNESKELANHMREEATERIQQARLEDYSSGQRGRRGRRGGQGPRAPGSRPRQPISLSFHYLDPAPFGWKDSRYEKLNLDDSLEFDKKATRGGSAGPSNALTAPLLPRAGDSWNREFIYRDK